MRTLLQMENIQVLHILNVCLKPWVSTMKCVCSILSPVACPALQYFSTFSHKRHDLRRGGGGGSFVKCRFSLQLLSETFLVLRRIERDVIKNEYWSLRKYPLFLSDFNEF